AEVLSMQLRDEPVRPRLATPEAEIPPSIERIVLRAMAKDPTERFASVRELTEAIIHADARLSRVTRTQLPAIPDEIPPTMHARAGARRASGTAGRGETDADVEEVLDPDEAFDIRTRAHADEDTVIFFNPAIAAQQAASGEARLSQVQSQLRRYQLATALLACTCFICFAVGWFTAARPQPSVAITEPATLAPPPSAETPAHEPEQPVPDPTPAGATSTGIDSEGSSTGNSGDNSETTDEEAAAPAPNEPTGEEPVPELERLSNPDRKALIAALKQPVQTCARFERIAKGTKLNIKLVVAAKSGTVRAIVPPIYQGHLFENCVKKASSKTRAKRGYRSAIVWGRYSAP
ncbi:MAG: hypothetical protein ACPG4T_03965, partial [Nannocystaceae bacterium]